MSPSLAMAFLIALPLAAGILGAVPSLLASVSR